MKISHFKKLRGEITIPGDKSISHRSIMIGSLAKGTSEINGFLHSADSLSTISCFQKLGISMKYNHITNTVLLKGNGLHGLHNSNDVLNVGNSGTTARLLSGILSAQPFSSTLIGDPSIQKRPMARIINPLHEMGANFQFLKKDDFLPFKITGGNLHGIHYISSIASAQVKSAILLAGLFAEGKTSITEPNISRNHTELMLQSFGIELSNKDTTVTINPTTAFNAQKINIPGDISSAAYFIAATLITPNSEITIKNVGINPTRDGILTVCKKMGAKITLSNINKQAVESSADITVQTSSLHGCIIDGDLIPKLIDEIPIIAIMASFADGTTIIKNAEELKVKESNRINLVVKNLSAMGVDIEGTDDGMIIHGGNPLHGAVIETKKDHRIAMSFTIAGGLAEGTTHILDGESVEISYPNFYKDLKLLSNQ